MGAEWWLRRSPPTPHHTKVAVPADGVVLEGVDKVMRVGEVETESPAPAASFPSALGEVHGVVKARASTNNVSILWPPSQSSLS